LETIVLNYIFLKKLLIINYLWKGKKEKEKILKAFLCSRENFSDLPSENEDILSHNAVVLLVSKFLNLVFLQYTTKLASFCEWETFPLGDRDFSFSFVLTGSSPSSPDEESSLSSLLSEFLVPCPFKRILFFNSSGEGRNSPASFFFLIGSLSNYNAAKKKKDTLVVEFRIWTKKKKERKKKEKGKKEKRNWTASPRTSIRISAIWSCCEMPQCTSNDNIIGYSDTQKAYLAIVSTTSLNKILVVKVWPW